MLHEDIMILDEVRETGRDLKHTRPSMVAHTCLPSYQGVGGAETG